MWTFVEGDKPLDLDVLDRAVAELLLDIDDSLRREAKAEQQKAAVPAPGRKGKTRPSRKSRPG